MTVYIAAKNPTQAVFRAVVITRAMAGWTVSAARIEKPEHEDSAVESVSTWWGAWCDWSDGNDSVTDAEFEEVQDWMNRTYDAIYALGHS